MKLLGGDLNKTKKSADEERGSDDGNRSEDDLGTVGGCIRRNTRDKRRRDGDGEDPGRRGGPVDRSETPKKKPDWVFVALLMLTAILTLVCLHLYLVRVEDGELMTLIRRGRVTPGAPGGTDF